MIGRLLRIEWIKARKRSAFQLAILILLVVLEISVGSRIYVGRRMSGGAVQFPGYWSELHGSMSQIVLFIALVTVVNLTAAEYMWRTARQNVIDGLSRDQFFLSKVMLVPLVSLLFILMVYVLGGATGLIFADNVDSLMTVHQLQAALGLLVPAMGFASVGLLASFLTRSTGNAVAVSLGYLTVGESILQVVMRRLGDDNGALARYLPGNVFEALTRVSTYDPAAMQAADRMRALMAARVSAPEPLTAPTLMGLALLYVAVCLALSYLLVRRQDL